jgi:hypothetical protein
MEADVFPRRRPDLAINIDGAWLSASSTWVGHPEWRH